MPTNVEQLVLDGAERVLARAGRGRALDAGALAPRLRATVEKYLLRHSPEASAREVGEFFDALHADELLLVAACERGDEAAWKDLIGQYRATVLSAARASSAGEAEAEELADTVWAELYGLRARGDGSPAGKLAYYSGCGSLGGWLRAVVTQLAVDRHRRTSRLVQTEEASEVDRAAAGSHSQERSRTSASGRATRSLARSQRPRARRPTQTSARCSPPRPCRPARHARSCSSELRRGSRDGDSFVLDATRDTRSTSRETRASRRASLGRSRVQLLSARRREF